MDWPRFGRAVRALRRRRGWRQLDLAAAAGLSQQVVSLVEIGRGGHVRARTVERIADALDARASVLLAWRGGELDRLLDARHARLVEAAVRRLRSLGWETVVEVSYRDYADRGSIDLVGWRPLERALVVVEAKTEVASVEATNRRHDEKVRLAAKVVGQRFGWRPLLVGRVLVLRDDSTARRQVANHAATFASVLPARGPEIVRWLRVPQGPLAGIWFLSDTTQRGGNRRVAPAGRVRLPRARTPCA